jgi:hypothetical protein
MSDMFDGGIVAGKTSRSITFSLASTVDGTEVTGKVASDMTAYYWRLSGTPTSISLSDLAAITTAWTSGGVKEADSTHQPGVYRLDLPDAAIASGVDWVLVTVKVTGSFLAKVWVPIVSNASVDNFTRLGAPAGASIAADLAEIEGETDSIATLTATIGTPAGASIAADLAEIEGETDAIGTPAGASVSADIAALKTELDAVKAKTDLLPSAIRKNTSQTYCFYLRSSSNPDNPALLQTPLVKVSLDGGAFSNAANTPATEIANGWYKIVLTTGDTNGDVVALQITASGAKSINVTLFTKAV